MSLNPRARCSVVNRQVALDDRPGETVVKSTPGFVNLAQVDSRNAFEDKYVTLLSAVDVTESAVKVETLDGEADRFGWQRIDVLKLHVLGLELPVLAGARSMLHRVQSLLVRGGLSESSWRQRLLAL